MIYNTPGNTNATVYFYLLCKIKKRIGDKEQ